MKAGLRHWARALLIALVVLGTSPFDLRAGQPAVVGTDLLTAADACCEPEVDAGHASECLPVCGTGGQALMPGSIELPPLSASNIRPEPDIGGDPQFADLEPHPPKRLSDTI